MKVDKKYTVVHDSKSFTWLESGLQINYSMLFVGLLPFVQMYFSYLDYINKYKCSNFVFAC